MLVSWRRFNAGGHGPHRFPTDLRVCGSFAGQLRAVARLREMADAAVFRAQTRHKQTIGQM